MRCYAVFAGAAYLVFLPFLIPAITQAHVVDAERDDPRRSPGVPGRRTRDRVVGSPAPTRTQSIAALGVLLAVALWPMAWNGNPIDDATVFWLGPFVVLGTICALVAWPTAVVRPHVFPTGRRQPFVLLTRPSGAPQWSASQTVTR